VTGAVLITGADGYLGRWLTREVLVRTDRPLLLWLHARDRASFADKRARLLADLQTQPGLERRVEICGGALEHPAPFAGLAPQGISHIIHSAAVTRFNVEADLARAVNLRGTEAVVALARRCPSLEALSLVSTIYASGLRAGSIRETPLPGEAGFANHYESSKWAAEQVVLAEAGALPARILRLPTLIADDAGGAVTQRNAFHNTLRLLHGGLLSVLPGDARVPLYFAAADWTARAVAALTFDGRAGGVYHLCHDAGGALPLGSLVDLAFAAFASDPRFRDRRLLRPPLCDQEGFALLGESITRLASPLLSQALGSILPFAAQLFVAKQVENDRLRRALPQDPPLPAPALARAVLGWMVRHALSGRRPAGEAIRP
jgi:nucleoside-diphosphate-sugar epimerase